MASHGMTSNSAIPANVNDQIELAWQMGRASLKANNNQLLINSSVYKLVGTAGLHHLKLRLSSQLGGASVIAYFDRQNDVVRLLEQPAEPRVNVGRSSQESSVRNFQIQNSAPIIDTQPRQLRAFGKKSKIPRPPNAFIIYRAQLHPHMKQHNPTLHNNEISKALGLRWMNEPEHVKEKYKKKALDMKARHAAEHPDYQYVPRKPGEKKKRMTARKLEKLRESHSTQETSSFPSPDASITDLFDTNMESESSNEAITYQENDTFTAVLPSSFDDIQGEIDRECGIYNKDYFDIAEEITDFASSPENHLLLANPTTNIQNTQNSWEALIDWQGLNGFINSTEDVMIDTEDLITAQSSGPDSKYMAHK